MRTEDLQIYRCPITLNKLRIKNEKIVNNRIKSGILVSDKGIHFEIEEFIPDFTWPKELANIDQTTRESYEKLALEYEKYADIPFQTFNQSNQAVREKIIVKLNLKENFQVLEIGGGDGRGAEYILKYIQSGKLYFQELSKSFLKQAIKRLNKFGDRVEFSIANASYLSFPDNYFDAAHHFGGISTFAEKERCLKELCRVVKPGGKIVIGDEGIGPWLKETQMAKIMINSNPLIGVDVPLSSLPVEARDVNVEWIMQGAYYIIDFVVGEGEPTANYHIKIPSERGGTHWSRYYGNLEGVSDEIKKIAKTAQKKAGMSMHDWLEQAIINEANKAK
ncbi:MAG: methyltransferase domain-containing protein [Bacteroidetes bacterium]|nr:methyltransferase domain-containing protein [Bacteroidota bacterium]